MSEWLIREHYPFSDRVPANWVSTSIESVSAEVTSGFPSGAHNSQGRGIPHIRPMNIDREGRFDLTEVKSVEVESPRLLRRGDVLFNNTNSPELIGKTTDIAVDTPLAFSNHMTRIALADGMDARFVARQLHYLWMSGYFRHRCKNHVNQASIASEPLSKSVPLLVAPESEQTRVADTLDELLSGLDAGVKALEGVRAKLKTYRAAVLKAAVEGALTAEWREKHRVTESASVLLNRVLAERRHHWEETQLQKFRDAKKEPPKDWKARYREPVAPDATNLFDLPEGWCWATVDQCSGLIQYGSSAKTGGDSKGVPVIRMGNIRSDGGLDFADLKYLPESHEEFPNLLLATGDLLFNRTNSAELVGKTGFYAGIPSPCSFASYLIRVKTMAGVLPQLVMFALNSAFGRQWIKTVVTQVVGQANVNGTKLASFAFPLAPEDEQPAIVEAAEDQISVIDHLEVDLDAKLKSSQALRQSILRSAFSGELVSQDLSDEPASELLKRFAAEREERIRLAKVTKQAEKKAKTNISARKRAVNA
jgi:type I restriction enzyme S subunit